MVSSGAIAFRRDSWSTLSSSSPIRHVNNICRRNSFSIAVFCPDIAAEESCLSQRKKLRPFSHSPGVYLLFSPKYADSGTKAPRPRCDSSGRPLEFVSISPCELISIKWPKSPVVSSTLLRQNGHSPGFYTRFQIHQSSNRCFDLTQRNTHNITRGELSERPSQSLNMTSQEESNAAPPPPRPQRIGRYHCRLPTAIPTELMAFLRCTRQ